MFEELFSWIDPLFGGMSPPLAAGDRLHNSVRVTLLFNPLPPLFSETEHSRGPRHRTLEPDLVGHRITHPRRPQGHQQATRGRAGRPAIDWTYWGIQQPSLTITADLMDAHASVGPALYLPLATGASLLAIFRLSSISTAIAGSPVPENRTADTRFLTLKSVISKHDELLSAWDDWHNNLDLIVNFSAFHEVQHETFTRTALETHRAAEKARANATADDAASVITCSTAVDELTAALK